MEFHQIDPSVLYGFVNAYLLCFDIDFPQVNYSYFGIGRKA